MAALSDVKIGSKYQNIEIGTSWLERDYDHCNKFYNWFELRNPFQMNDGNLHSLSSGIVSVYGSDPVNCDEAESIGVRIQANLDGVNFTEVLMLVTRILLALTQPCCLDILILG